MIVHLRKGLLTSKVPEAIIDNVVDIVEEKYLIEANHYKRYLIFLSNYSNMVIAAVPVIPEEEKEIDLVIDIVDDLIFKPNDVDPKWEAIV